MSYILEAIKKADQKRKLGSVPDVHTVHEGPAPAAGRLWWPYALAAGLFFNAVLIVLWLHPWSAKVPPDVRGEVTAVVTHRADDSQKKPTPPAVQKNTKNVVDVEPAVSGDDTASPVSNVPVEEHASAAVEIKAKPVPEAKKVTGEVGTADTGATMKTIPTVANTGNGDVAVQDAGADNSEPVAKSPLESLSSSADSEAVVVEKPEIVERIGGQPLPSTNYAEKDLMAEQQRAEEAKKLDKIPFLRQMPADYRKDIPEIHISFHAYAYNPAKRLVSINGRIYREGAKLPGDLKLEQITPGGAVISYKDHSFRVKI